MPGEKSAEMRPCLIFLTKNRSAGGVLAGSVAETKGRKVEFSAQVSGFGGTALDDKAGQRQHENR